MQRSSFERVLSGEEFSRVFKLKTFRITSKEGPLRVFYAGKNSRGSSNQRMPSMLREALTERVLGVFVRDMTF